MTKNPETQLRLPAPSEKPMDILEAKVKEVATLIDNGAETATVDAMIAEVADIVNKAKGDAKETKWDAKAWAVKNGYSTTPAEPGKFTTAWAPPKDVSPSVTPIRFTTEAKSKLRRKYRPLVEDARVGLLLDMLTYKRSSGSISEAAFIKRFIDSMDRVQTDSYGNRWVQVGKSPILWSCHIDSVHHKDGRQHVEVVDGFARIKDRSGNCLGADDAAGIWLMKEMIRAHVPGLYIFHRDEETGGQGSTHIAKYYADQFKDIKCAIALDRKGYDNVITHQGSRCCSDVFARSLAKALNKVRTGTKMTFMPDDTGLFTDTANYTDVIGECTNLSVGYHRQHGPTESLDLGFLLDLRSSLISGDFSKLEFSRQPGEKSADDWAGFGYGSYGGYSGGDSYGGYFNSDRRHGSTKTYKGTNTDKEEIAKVTNWKPTVHRGREESADLTESEKILELVMDHPERVADLLEGFGYNATELNKAIWEDVDVYLDDNKALVPPEEDDDDDRWNGPHGNA